MTRASLWLVPALLAGCLPAFPDAIPGTTPPPVVEDADNDGYTVDEGDCDDENDAIYPNANERCDGVDNDCNDDIDDDAIDAALFYADTDGDTFGDPGAPLRSCEAPVDYVADNEDCDDELASVNPDAVEICDDLDNNCDLVTDDDATDQTTWYLDLDDDTYGDDTTAVIACDAPLDSVDVPGDCNDLNPSVNEGGTEVCGGEDEDCDGLEDDLDPSVTGQPLWYADGDDDGFGDDSDPGTAACSQPADTAPIPGDCNDASGAYNPNALEPKCFDPEDYNCDGSTGFADNDNDGFAACEECDDLNPNANPGALEVCDAANVDEDCDGAADDADPEGPTAGRISSYPDGDGDGFGDAGAAAAPICDIVPGISADNLDCDDTDDLISPDGVEICDPEDDDEDCNNQADDGDPGASGLLPHFEDTDLDGFGATPPAPVMQCDASPGLSPFDTDCDDNRDFVNPGAPEACDATNRDDDCDGFGDDLDPEGAETNTLSFFLDGDGDTFGDLLSERVGCDAQLGEITAGGDCDDIDANVNPGELEVCDPADLDEDCDGGGDDADPDGPTGTTDLYPDSDGDSFGDAGAVARPGCDAVGNEVADGTDCDDGVDTTFPGALEQCNNVQDDCADLAWTDDDGVVTAVDLGGVSDLTATFAVGVAGAPAAVTLPADSTVTVCPGTYFVTLTAPDPVDLVGFSGVASDVVLSGDGLARVLMVGGGAVVSVTDLTIADGSAGDGAGILANGDLTLDNVTLTGNAATNEGGALWTTGLTTLLNNTFTLNSAMSGGAIYVDGGSVFATGDAVLDNDATVSGGGWYLANGALVDMTNVTTTLNTAMTGAGGYLADGTLDCSGVTGAFVNNVATVTGGGIELVAGTVISTTCDWAPGNTPDDVRTPLGAEFYGLNATFTCTPAAGCIP